MIKYSIKDLERISGIKAHTIRIWEQRYNVLTPSRSESNIREYCCEDLRKIITYGALNSRGIKISKLVELSEEELAAQILEFSQNCDDTEFQIERMAAAMVELNEKAFSETLSFNISNRGFEQTMNTLIYPFLDRIGVLWQIGTVSPAQEHFMSNLIRQKLIAAYDSCPSPKKPKGKILAFLPEGEWHELGLLYYSYVAKLEGYQVIYLGQSTPYEGMLGAITIQEPTAVLMSFVQSVEPNRMKGYIDALVTDIPNLPIYLTGIQAKQLVNTPKNISVFSHIDDFRKAALG